VLADLVGMRNTALALHRNLERHAVYGDVRLVCLHGDDAVPEELQRSVTLLSRQVPDADLRAALTSKPPERNLQAPVANATDEGATGRLRNARVLLVEDNPVNLMVGQRLLGVLGVDCDIAGNGEAALLRMSASRYDVVLMDCQMPVMDGYTATRRWRASEEAASDGNHLPIVAMTANAMAGDRQKCIDAGMDDYLAKPVTRAELERCLHRWWRPQANPGPRYVLPEPAASLPVSPPAVAISAPEPEIVYQGPLRELVAQEHVAHDHDGGAVIDSDVIDELRLALGSEVEQLINVFLDDTPMLIARLEAAALAPDMDMLREVAHSLKSSSANLGAMALSSAAKRVELGVRTGTLDRPAVAVAMVSSEFTRACEALRALNTASARPEPAV
jgi:CheY-like chemotaxis protein